MRKKVLLGAAIVLAVLLVGFGFSSGMFFDETLTVRFNSYQELGNSDYMSLGWFPSDFPQNTVEIIETHDIDSNNVWIESFYKGSPGFGERKMEKLNKSELPRQFARHFKIRGKHIQYFGISEYEYLAIDERLRKLYYHRDGVLKSNLEMN
ncbi:MAG: hypothetical protein B0D92_05500 [Spirochaeta sp. LUC14_002_19_P3]|nr:MAG: hypothetical protein B0D92_05500 [Spirochaeta sp. LUC14_002_19_P3]